MKDNNMKQPTSLFFRHLADNIQSVACTEVDAWLDVMFNTAKVLSP
jgi:hypothetical protein